MSYEEVNRVGNKMLIHRKETRTFELWQCIDTKADRWVPMFKSEDAKDVTRLYPEFGVIVQ